uniref:THAP-type domain-containing protein n=1 Tax=Trichogramma kaykai TaxID=54128 RepID=A0ABD2VRT2_9HYME
MQSIGQEDSVIEESVSMIEGNDSEIERKNSIIEADSVINRADITEEVPVNVTENHTIARQKKVLCAAKKCILSLAKANKKLKSRNQLLQQKVRRLQQMCRRSLKRAKDRKIKKCEIIEAAAEHCNKNFMILLNMQLNHEDRKLEWSATEKYFALDLYYRSPKLYKHMRNGLKFALPCLTVMKKWVNEINLAPGANEDLFKLLTVKSESMNQYEKQCVMMWDEMSIRSCLEYNEKDDYIEGFEDLGEYGRTNAIATQVLVIMLSGLQSNWKQAIFFGFSKGSVSTETLKKIIIDMLDKIENTGLQVKMMVCDQGTANQKLIANFEISEARPYILKFGRKIFFNFDAPHLFKCWRNNMMDNDFLIGDNQVSWECIKELRDLERDKPCRAAPKLSDRHLNPNNFQKMNVKLAVQIFSASVSRAMITGYHCGDLKHPHCEATAAFLWSMNKLFDHINARHANDANPDRRGLSQKNPAVENSLRNFIPWLENIAVVSKPSPPCFRNLILTIQGILGLWEEKKREGQFYLLTGKLNQDPLENYFAFMRYLSGCNTHPTAMKFRYNHQHGTIMSLLFPPPGANCKPDDCINLLSTLSEIKLQKNADNIDQKETDDYVDKKLNAWLINDYAYAEVEDSPSPKTDLGDQNQPTLLKCSMKYVAGYLAHKYNGAEDNIQFDSSSKTSKKKSSDFHNYESKKISMTYSWSNINVYHVLPDKNLWRPFIKRQLKNSNKKHLLRDEIREDLDKLVVGRTRLPPSRLIESASELEVPSTCENEQTDQLKEQEADAMREIMKNKMASVANLQCKSTGTPYTGTKFSLPLRSCDLGECEAVVGPIG